MRTKNAVQLLVLLVLCVSACSTAQPSPTPAVAPTQEMRSSEGLQAYQGEGFSFQYPKNARVEKAGTDPTALSEVRILGPDVFVKPGDADWAYQGPGYELTVQTYSNPDGMDAEAWARNYVLTAWQQAKDRGEPTGIYPVSDSGEIEEEKLGQIVLAGYPAFYVNYFAFDSTRRVFYLSDADQIIAFSYYDYPVENQPLAPVQQGVYALIMSTLTK